MLFWYSGGRRLMGNTTGLKQSWNIGIQLKFVNDCPVTDGLSLIVEAFYRRGQMLLQYIHFVNRCIKRCICLPFHRTVNWPSVPAATQFPQGPKSPPNRPKKPSGAMVPGPRLVVLPHLQKACVLFVEIQIFNLCTLHDSVVPAAAKEHECAT